LQILQKLFKLYAIFAEVFIKPSGKPRISEGSLAL